MSILFSKTKMPALQIGSVVKGKWNSNEYLVKKSLGFGENGVVYLVEHEERYYALKVSDNSLNLSNEIHIINSIKDTQGHDLGFSIFDVDDMVDNHTTYSFYVMPYHKGISIENYLRGKGQEEYVEVFKKTVYILSLVHKQGWVYGDLKPEHILIDPQTKKIVLIDFGGITLMKRGVRQFTEIYDRGSWKAGTRKADAHYDIFTLIMIFVKIGIGRNKFLGLYNQSRRISKVYDIIRKINVLKPLRHIFVKVIKGQWKDSEKILYEVDQVVITNEVSLPYRWIDYLFVSTFIIFSTALFLFTYF